MLVTVEPGPAEVTVTVEGGPADVTVLSRSVLARYQSGLTHLVLVTVEPGPAEVTVLFVSE